MRTLVLPLTLLLAVTASAVNIYTSTLVHPFCGYSNGYVIMSVDGGTPPFSYAWGDGPVTLSRYDLPPGTYTVTVTDGLGATDQETVVLEDQPDMGPFLGASFLVDGLGYHPCPGQCDGLVRAAVEFLAGVPPYDVYMDVGGTMAAQQGTDQNGNPYFGPFCNNDNVNIYVTDANGCSSTGTALVTGPDLIPSQAIGVTGACGGAANGAAAIQVYTNTWQSEVIVKNSDQDVVFQESAFGDASFDVEGLAAGDYGIYQQWSATAPYCELLTGGFSIPDLGPTCGTVSGNVFVDVDLDCMPGVGDVVLPTRLVRIQPGDQYTLTDATGAYDANLLYGAHTVEALGADIAPLCPLPSPVDFTIDAGNPDAVVDLAVESLIPFDLSLDGGSGPARPGFAYQLACHVYNGSIIPSGPLTLTLILDAAVSYDSATPVPTTVNGNTLTWDLAELGSFGQAHVYVQAQVPPDPGLLGTVLSSTATVSAAQGELDLGNNTDIIERTVTGSYDPNDKLVEPADVFLLDVDEYLDYTIRFQNTGTDTAFTVVVVDTLAAELDIASLHLGAASHPYVPELEGRTLRFRFNNIHLPDSGINEAASHGFVAFRIKPVQGLLPGTWLRNGAGIHFDFNPPIITPLAEVVTGISTGIPHARNASWTLVPNPATDRVVLRAPDASSGTYRVQFIAADGRVALEQQLTGERTMDVSALRPGAYAVRIEHAAGQEVLRLVKW